MSVATRRRSGGTQGRCAAPGTAWRRPLRSTSSSGPPGWKASASSGGDRRRSRLRPADASPTTFIMSHRPATQITPTADAAIESEQQVWSGRFPLEVVKFRNRRFDGRFSETRTWELWRRGRAAALLPYDPVADAVVLIEQFRLPALAAGLDPVLVELPAGLCEAGEDPAETIHREML